MKRATIILFAFTGFFFAAYSAVPRAYASHNQIPANPEEWLGESETPPLLSQDPAALPPLPENVKKLVNAQAAVFDISVVESDLKGYPIPHTKVVYVALLGSEKMVVSLVVALDSDFSAPETIDENSVLEIRWFSTQPENLNAPTIKMEFWVNSPLIQKIVEEMMGEKPDEKITT